MTTRLGIAGARAASFLRRPEEPPEMTRMTNAPRTSVATFVERWKADRHQRFLGSWEDRVWEVQGIQNVSNRNRIRAAFRRGGAACGARRRGKRPEGGRPESDAAAGKTEVKVAPEPFEPPFGDFARAVCLARSPIASRLGLGRPAPSSKSSSPCACSTRPCREARGALKTCGGTTSAGRRRRSGSNPARARPPTSAISSSASPTSWTTRGSRRRGSIGSGRSRTTRRAPSRVRRCACASRRSCSPSARCTSGRGFPPKRTGASTTGCASAWSISWSAVPFGSTKP